MPSDGQTLDDLSNIKDHVNNSYISRITFVAALGGLLFGYDTAVIAGAIGSVKANFGLTGAEMGWAASSALIGSLVGAAMGGFVSLKLGRKRALIISAILFVISAVGTALPDSLTELVVFRMIGGVGVGMASMVSPMFIAELAPPHIRGKLVSYQQFAIVIGILVVYFVNYFISGLGDSAWNISTGWRWMFGSEAVPAITFFALLFLVPESPRWLALKGKMADAEAILTKIGGKGLAKVEMKEIEQSIVSGKDQSKKLTLASRGVISAIIIGVTISVFQQATGINVILYYGPEIFKSMGSKLDAALLLQIIAGAVNLVFTLIAMATVDKFGRKPLWIIGSIGMAIGISGVGFAAFFEYRGVWALILMLLFIGSFAMSLGPVTWVLLSEMFPNKVRGMAMSVAVAAQWVSNFIVSQTFPMMSENTYLVDRFHGAFPFWIYGLMCVGSIVFGLMVIPETKGKSLEEIEAFWDNNRK